MVVWVEYKKHATTKIGIKTPGGVNMVKRLLAWPLIALFSIISFTVIAQAATIEFFTPKGTSKKVRQVKVRFSDQMVAFGDPRRGWDFVSPGRGDVKWDPIIRALNRIGYQGPLAIEWEDNGMDREWGAPEALAMIRRQDFTASAVAHDAAFRQAY